MPFNQRVPNNLLFELEELEGITLPKAITKQVVIHMQMMRT
jgi:hypothetical protein